MYDLLFTFYFLILILLLGRSPGSSTIYVGDFRHLQVVF